MLKPARAGRCRWLVDALIVAGAFALPVRAFLIRPLACATDLGLLSRMTTVAIAAVAW